MSKKKTVEKQIRQEVDYLLSEIDIDAEISKIVSNGKLKANIRKKHHHLNMIKPNDK